MEYYKLTKKQKKMLEEIGEDWVKMKLEQLENMKKEIMQEMEKLADNKERIIFLESIKINEEVRGG